MDQFSGFRAQSLLVEGWPPVGLKEQLSERLLGWCRRGMSRTKQVRQLYHPHAGTFTKDKPLQLAVV